MMMIKTEPMKPEIEWFRSGACEAYCPNCNEVVYSTYGQPNEKHERCHRCGQLLDWTEEDEV